MSEEARAQRAAARQKTMTIQRSRMQPVERDLDPIRGEAAVSLVRQLTWEGWAASGREFPAYARADIPVRFIPRERK